MNLTNRLAAGLPALVVLALAALSTAPTRAQQAPPPPLPLQEVDFPDFRETTLSNGARVVVVPNGEVPLVTVNLVLPGGTAADPDGREGTASLLAQLLTQGTPNRTHEEIAEALDFLGATLGASASADFLSVGLGSLTGALDEALAVMADAVVNPVFPDDRVELLRTQTLSALQVELSSASAVAGRSFVRALYGEHPYAKQPTPMSVESIARGDLVAFHARHFNPAAALFVIAGDVTLEGVTASLERAFSDWAGSAVEPVEYADAWDRAAPEVILVHKPGSVQAEVRIGHLLKTETHEDWTVLSVANQVLGGGPSSRLFQVLREDRGYTYGASSGLSRRQGQGYFQASMAVRNEVLEAALTDMIREVDRLRDQLVPAEELEDTKDFLVGSFPLQIETPQQVATQVMNNRLLGLPEDAIETYRSRVAALDAETVRQAFRRYVEPGKMAIVVVGDASVIQAQLQSFGPLTLLDVAGNVLEASQLAPQGRSEALSARGLGPMQLSYLVFFQGNQVGTTDRVLEVRPDGSIRLASEAQLGPQVVEQEVTAGVDDLDFRTSRMTVSMQGQSMGGDVRVEGGRIVGSLTSPAGSQPVDMEAPPGVVVSDMLELAVWVADLREGMSMELPVANIQSGTVENVTITVIGREEITVPAGTFDTWRVRVEGSEAQTLWARVAAPHLVVQLQPAGQPIVVQLSALGEGS
jgi:zinc protease